MFGSYSGRKTCGVCHVEATTYGHPLGYLCASCYLRNDPPKNCPSCKGSGISRTIVSGIVKTNIVCRVCNGGGCAAVLTYESVEELQLEGMP